MSDTAKRRRLWPWIVLVGILLLFLGQLVWKYRPLNGTERRLVGTWSGDELGLELCLSANRRFDGSVIRFLLSTKGGVHEVRETLEDVSWTANDDRIEITYPMAMRPGPLTHRLHWLVRDFLSPPDRESMIVSFESDDRIQVQGHEFIRLP